MFLDLNDIREGVDIDTVLDLPDLETPDGERSPISNCRLRGRAAPGERGIEFRATCEATLGLRCSRCLTALEFGVSEDVALVLTHDATTFAAKDTRIDREDTEFFYAEGGKVDLRRLATEQLYLQVPMKPVCDPGCRGLCPRCGEDLNRSACTCEAEPVDPRLAPLLAFRNGQRGASEGDPSEN